MLLLYRILLYLLVPVVLLRLLFRGLRNRDYFQRIGERFGFSCPPPPGGGVWVHAVSVGEVNAATPLIDRLLEAHPGMQITVTTMTPTGSARVLEGYGARVEHCYLPYDLPGAVARFLDHLQPELAVIMETEIWPNLLRGCARRSIPVLFANVRLSEKSYRGYARFRTLFAPRLREVAIFAVQAEPDAERLIRLGARAESVRVTGSIKFDIRLPASVSEAAQSVRRELGRERPVWVAGSTHEGEEATLLELQGLLRKQHPGLLLVLVPRHPERFAGVARLSARLGLRTARRSETRRPLEEGIEVYVGDTMGELPLLIAAGDVAFIGGSLVATGGHNILEACAAGLPVLFGPHMFNFKQIAEMVVEQGAGVQVQDAGELEEVVSRFLRDADLRDRYGSAGLALIDQNRGALERIYTLLLDIWRR